MDFSKFSDDNFEVKEWVNSALRMRESNTPVDAHASTLVMKLQLFIQEVNNALEETSQQALNNVPRVLREIENVKQEASLLKGQMELVKEDIKRVEQNTAESMSMLMELDDVKSRLYAASNALQEADNWSTLSVDVDKVFESGDIEKISEKLVGMHKSLNVLHDVPDYEERHRLLEGLKNKLEALLSPKLVSAFNNHSLEEAQEYVRIFIDMDRLEQLQNYYNRTHKTKLLKTWKKVREEDPNRTMLEWLAAFYDVILSTWHTEVNWCSQVFPNPVSVLCSLFTQTLQHLDPTLPACIAEFIRDESQPLEKLIHLRQVTLRFAQSLKNAITGQEIYCPSAVQSLVDVVFSPYVPYMLDYATMEHNYLMEQINSLEFKADGFLETTGLLSDSASKIFQLAQESVEHCVKMTDGYAAYGLTNTMEMFFAAYIGKLSTTVSELRVLCNLDKGFEHSDETEEFHEDWTLFQNAFRLIQMCGDIIMRKTELNDQMFVAFVDCANRLLGEKLGLEKSDEDNVLKHFDSYDYLYKERPSEHTMLIEFIQKLKTGGKDILILPSVAHDIQGLNERAHMFAYDVIFSQLQQQFSTMPKLKAWALHGPESGASLNEDLPSFSLSPQPYITQIGDYLLTLPQQLEPFLTRHNPSLDVALREGKLPFPDPSVSDEEHDHAIYWLGAIARGATHTFLEAILRIHELTPHSTKQLLADIGYFCNVLEALEVSPGDNISHARTLLEVEPDRFHQTAAEMVVDERIKNGIAASRCI